MKRYFTFIFLLTFVIGVTILFFFISPIDIIEIIGVRNGYLVIFLFAFFGGISSFTSVSFYITVISFSVGGLNPIFIALVAGPGLLFGDTIFYYFGSSLHEILSPKIQKHVALITNFLNKPKIYKWSPAFIYLYVGISPLPPDILILTLSISEYPYKRMIAPILLGEMTFVVLVSTLAQYGVRVFGL